MFIAYNGVFFVEMFGNGLIFPIISPLLAKTNSPFITNNASLFARDFIYCMVLFLPALTMLFATPFISSLSDYIDRKKCLLFCLIGTAFSYFVNGLSLITHSLFLLLFGRTINGFTTASIALAQTEVIIFSPAERIKNLGYMTLTIMLGYIAGSSLASIFDGKGLQFFNPAVLFFFAAVITLWCAIMIFLWMPNIRFKKETFSLQKIVFYQKDAFNLLYKPNIGPKCLFFLWAVVAWNLQFQYVAFYLTNHYHYNQRTLGLLFTFGGFFLLLGLIILKEYLIKYFDTISILLMNALLITLSACIFMYHSSLASWFAIAPLAIGIILGQACYAGSITFEVALEEQGTISGITTAIYTLALCISILLSGLLCTINIRLPFLCSGLSSLLLMLYLLKK